MEKITQAECLNQSFKEAKETVFIIHKRAQCKKFKSRQILLLQKGVYNRGKFFISGYNPKTKNEVWTWDFNNKEQAEHCFNKNFL